MLIESILCAVVVFIVFYLLHRSDKKWSGKDKGDGRHTL